MKLNEYIEITNEDNMELMARYPDKYFDLSIIDPPYGIGESMKKRENTVSDKWKNPYKKQHDPKEWDKQAPDKDYFDELMRVSKNQIIFGANHFISKIPYDSSCWLVWDKKNGESDFADCELAWTSFDKAVRKFEWLWNGFQKQKPETRIHPTQKPVALYAWILKNYAKQGDKIIDTHFGSGSIACAVHNANSIDKMDLSLVACELDKDYFESSIRRVKAALQTQSLF